MILPSANETSAAIYGAWRLLRLDRNGMDYFDRTPDGFWKSFGAAVIIAPAYLILVLIHLSEAELEAGFPIVLLVEAIGYVISWTAFPLIVHRLAAAMGREQRYVGYIVAFNWSKVIQMLIYLPISLLAFAGLLPDGIAGLLTIAISLGILGYIWFVTTTALDVGGLPAAGLVMLDLVIGLVFTVASDRMLG